ncbi:SurA N-terminal domain-containing protein [Virgibacillus soli]|uniref:SurA N-terminal domain-containing protein n=1 Tax=Paracerasibacillus soli TaxID=480284 RepID=A0ABU5CX07_9BACI|nr:SurA N-terminal domain-containing protein [Virgibacillus soli]MDY0410397.1 SurA N-terminal domain-containing protein [Virgibacillus soli]
MKKTYLLLIAVLFAVVLTACNSDKDKEKDTKQADMEKLEVTDAEKVANDKVVLEVNDEKVNGNKYNTAYIQTKMRLYQIGQDIDDLEQVKDKTLDELIAQELLRQEIENKGFSVSNKDVDAEYEAIKKENGDQLKAYLKEFSMTEDDFKEQVKYSLALEKYLDKEVKTPKVSDKEIKDMYDKLKENNDDIPEYKDVADIIKEQLEQQKKEEELKTIIDALEEKAEVKKLI